ncbi:MAG: hypothetical protein KA116_10910 [Proteobacteria bacterium]|jgi:Sec-independent protein translocase protein TatA|nr:hypothetical protein [Pseudomonadota bacterium]
MEISFFEMLLVLLIAFLVLGPKELVIKSQQIGRLIGRWRTQWENLKILAQEEAQALELKANLKLKEDKSSELKQVFKEPLEPHV